MGKFADISIIILLFLIGIAVPNYGIWLGFADIAAKWGYQYGFLGAACLIGFVVLGLSFCNSGQYGLSTVSQVLLVYLAAVFGIGVLGGISFGWNPALLLGTAVLVSLSAPPVPALAGLLFIWIDYLIFSFNQMYFFLPMAPAINQPAGLEDVGFPLVSLTAICLIVMVGNYLRTRRFLSALAGKIGNTGKEETHKIVEHRIRVNGDAEDAGQADPRFESREYIAQRDIESRTSMQSILESVVYFMSKNFKAFSALGFVASHDEEEFYLNASVTKSKHLKKDVVIRRGKHMLGLAVRKKSGFVSGEVKSYPAQIEYYEQPEDINSILVMPIREDATGRVDGLLVVDSDRIRNFKDEDKELLGRFTQIASAMISNARMTSQVHKDAKWVDTLYETTRSLTKMLDVWEILKMMGNALSQIFPNDRVVTCVYNSKSRKGSIWNIIGDKGGLERGLEFEIQHEKSLYGRAFRNKEEILFHNFRQDDQFMRFNSSENPGNKPEELLVVPLKDSGKQTVFAVVGLESNTRGAYSDKEQRMLSTLKTNFSNFVEKAMMYTKLERLATIDGLTGVPNHRKFQETLSEELYRSKRYKENLSVLLMDIDHFKKFNDTYGHPVGDVVLKSVANKIKETIRTSDMVARYGGEEFTVIVLNADEEKSITLAGRICEAIEAMDIENNGKLLKVTISIGSATFPQDVQTKQELIDAADKALYYSKEHGRNRASCFSQMK